ncbi:uncharacterized protein MELLADRAFT_106368 [Melampsora larici-populina 98AG31]|uniref:Uncharacterized protein n=1 Tax=Melampsora larici-populina (strain 98AG31 / pathotype 3-4-7) TaxID=747676 RepID=F4RL56_MELLP|nr:uncharacterized protein MELLADRAFT_106368 [Melampsora larici-populina 98AG31]EGG06845.1 hypothetical protein MELLADRAFT_106368 [Melampsora larici-populina 98AG31]
MTIIRARNSCALDLTVSKPRPLIKKGRGGVSTTSEAVTGQISINNWQVFVTHSLRKRTVVMGDISMCLSGDKCNLNLRNHGSRVMLKVSKEIGLRDIHRVSRSDVVAGLLLFFCVTMDSSSADGLTYFLPKMGQRITPKRNYQRTNLICRKDLITPWMSERQKSEVYYLDIPATAMIEVRDGEDQCFTCSLFGHAFVDCPVKGMPPREDFGDWRLVENGRVYSLLALWPELGRARALAKLQKKGNGGGTQRSAVPRSSANDQIGRLSGSHGKETVEATTSDGAVAEVRGDDEVLTASMKIRVNGLDRAENAKRKNVSSAEYICVLKAQAARTKNGSVNRLNDLGHAPVSIALSAIACAVS